MANADSDATRIAEIVRRMGSTAGDVALFMADLGETAPLLGPGLTLLMNIREKVETVRYCREKLKALERRCTQVTAGVIDKRRRDNTPTSGVGPTSSLQELNDCVTEVGVFVGRCSRRSWWTWLLKATSDKDEIDELNARIDRLTIDLNLSGIVIMDGKLDGVDGKLDGVDGKLDAVKGTLVQNKIARMRSSAKVPPGAPPIQYWYVEREEIFTKIINHLGIRSSSNSSHDPQMVGLAGQAGAGKSTVASMMTIHVDVLTFFDKGVVWLPVGQGQGSEDRLPDLMFGLATTVWEDVLLKTARAPRKLSIGNKREDGGAYLREVVSDGSQRFLVVADDVWEEEVLKELRAAGVWVLYTSRYDNLAPDAPVRLDQILKEEAERLLRRAAELRDGQHLPQAAYDLMGRCEFVAMDLAFVGRWKSVVWRRSDAEAWQRALDIIIECQHRGEDGRLLPWRTAVLHAGLDELAADNPQNRELYLSLAILPKGLVFNKEVAAVLLYSESWSSEDLKAATRVVETLECWSVLTREQGGKYRLHDSHADFVRGRLAESPHLRDRARRWWQGYLSTLRALLSWPPNILVKLWGEMMALEVDGVVGRPYDAALAEVDPFDVVLLSALRKVGDFYLFGGHPYDAKAGDQWRDYAVDHYTKALQAIEAANVGIDHPAVATVLDRVLLFSISRHNVDEIEQLLIGVLSIQEDTLDPHHPGMAVTLAGLATCARLSGREKEADGWFNRARDIKDANAGGDELYFLGVDNFRNGKCTESAETFLRRALATRVEELGVDNLEVANTMNVLGHCALHFKRIEEAENWLRRALAIRESQLGAGDLKVADTLHTIGMCASDSRRFEEAETLHRRALAIRESQLEVDHLGVARSLSHVARCAVDLERVEEAEKLHRRALAIRESQLEADHLDVASDLYNIGWCALNLGRTTEAKTLLQRALAIRVEVLGADHVEVGNTLNILGDCALESGRVVEALIRFKGALAVRENAPGANPLDVASTLYSLGVCLTLLGQHQEVEDLLRRALIIRVEVLGSDHLQVAYTQQILGMCVAMLGRLEEAEEILRQAYATIKGLFGADDPRLDDIRAGILSCTWENLRLEWVGSKKDVPHSVHHRFGKPLQPGFLRNPPWPPVLRSYGVGSTWTVVNCIEGGGANVGIYNSQEAGRGGSQFAVFGTLLRSTWYGICTPCTLTSREREGRGQERCNNAQGGKGAISRRGFFYVDLILASQLV